MPQDELIETWPFWAPSEAEAVAEALALGGVTTGTRVLDLGCGDGQVLQAAAALGAIVSGIEADPDLADEARTRLAEAGVDATISTADLFDPAVDFSADVLFTYLAPATLQRLVARLGGAERRTLVSVDFDIPGLIPTRRAGAARSYTLPGRRRALGPVGWPCAATLVAAVPEHYSLTCLELVHPGGLVDASLSGSVADAVTVLTGADHLDAAAHLAIDLRWEPQELGDVFHGAIEIDGLPAHPLFVTYTDVDDGVWELTDAAATRLAASVTSSNPPATLEALLAVAEPQPLARS